MGWKTKRESEALLISHREGCQGGHLLARLGNWGLVLKLDLKKRGVLVRMLMDRMCERRQSPPTNLAVPRGGPAQAGDQVRPWRQVCASTALALRTFWAGRCFCAWESFLFSLATISVSREETMKATAWGPRLAWSWRGVLVVEV